MTKDGHGRETAILVATIFVVFVLATLKRVADVTQVSQLGRYYMPVFVLALPPAVSGIMGWLDSLARWKARGPVAGCHVVRAGVGRPDLGLRRVVADQAISASLARTSQRGRVDPGQSRRGFRPRRGS